MTDKNDPISLGNIAISKKSIQVFYIEFLKSAQCSNHPQFENSKASYIFIFTNELLLNMG